MTNVVLVVEVVVVAAVVFAVAALAMGRLDPMSTTRPDTRARPLPDGEVHAADVDGVRFGMVFRGYRMSEVDEVLGRLATELALRDSELMRRDSELERLAAFLHGYDGDGSGGDDAPDGHPEFEEFEEGEARPRGRGPDAARDGGPDADARTAPEDLEDPEDEVQATVVAASTPPAGASAPPSSSA